MMSVDRRSLVVAFPEAATKPAINEPRSTILRNDHRRAPELRTEPVEVAADLLLVLRHPLPVAVQLERAEGDAGENVRQLRLLQRREERDLDAGREIRALLGLFAHDGQKALQLRARRLELARLLVRLGAPAREDAQGHLQRTV